VWREWGGFQRNGNRGGKWVLDRGVSTVKLQTENDYGSQSWGSSWARRQIKIIERAETLDKENNKSERRVYPRGDKNEEIKLNRRFGGPNGKPRVARQGDDPQTGKSLRWVSTNLK